MSKHFLASCLATPWAMDPKYIKSFGDVLVRAYMVKDGKTVAMEDDELDSRGPLRAGPRQPPKVGGGSIQVISVKGAIAPYASDIGMCDGGTSCQDISQQLKAANADDSVGQILLFIDSPGGNVHGVMELADEIRASGKPVVAYAGYTAASAAYWLGTAASEFYVAPSGQVGSIGVYMIHQDVSKAMEAEGVVTKFISAGKFKTEGNPFEPLSEEAEANLQQSVDSFYTTFVKAVAQGRNVSVDDVRNDMGQGRVLDAPAALKAGMVDGVATFDQVVAGMQKKGKKATAARSRAEIDIAELT